MDINRKTEYENYKEAEKNGWIEPNELGKYHITALGKSVIDLSETPVDSISFELASQIIDIIKMNSERPKAKCTVVIKNAKKIKELDDNTVHFERFITHDGLGLAENNTYLKASAAALVDSILV